MADIDIDPFGEHESRPEEPTDENIPLTPVTPGRSTWEPEHEQEMSFGSLEVLLSRGEIIHKEYLVGEIYELIGNKMHQRLEPNLRLFELEDGRLYYRGKPLMNRNGELKTIGILADTLGIRGLREMGYNITKTNLKPRFVLDLLEKQAELPSSSEIANMDEIELEEIAKSTEDLIYQINKQTQTDDLLEYPLRELLGLDKQLKSIRGSLKVEVAKKLALEEHIKKERRKLEEFRKYPGEYDDAMREDITKRIDALNDDLATRQESIDLLKGRLKNQITSFKETISKVLDNDTSLGQKIRTLFREQGITIASILMAIGMAIRVLVEALLPGGGGAAAESGGEPPPKDEKGLKEWVRSKLKALASLLGKLGMKAAEALPGIIGGIISCILNRAKDVVGWVSQNLWALVVSIGGLIYTYMVTRK